MKKKSHVKYYILTGLLMLALAAGVTGRIYASNLWDKDRAVHINPSEIETSTFAIGTHLIHLSALNPELYQIAMDSAGESMQEQIYYKSELGDDAWFNIASATSLADISTEGTPVSEQEIKDIYFTHHTKSDKKTYDLRTNQQVNIFNIHSPYELEDLEELLPLKMQYDLLRETKGKEDFAKRIDLIWSLPVSGNGAPDTIKELDKQMDALQRYLNVLTEHDAPAEQTGKVNGVMKAVDEARRYEVFAILDPALQTYLEELNNSASEEKEKNQPPAELMPAVADSIGNVQNALIKHGGARLSEGVTVVSNSEYRFSMSLIEHAMADNHRACDDDVQDLLFLDNIENNKITDRPQELTLLEEQLLDRATDAYTDVLSAGESPEYRAEKKKQSSKAVLKSMINAHGAAASTTRGELEFLIDAQCTRLDPAAAIKFIDERLDLTTDSFATIYPKDDFATEAGNSVEDHIEYLTDKRRSLEQALGGNEMDKLLADKDDLKDKRLDALDRNDLKTAQDLEKQLKELEEKIRNLESETAAQLKKLQDELKNLKEGTAEHAAIRAELANLENSLSDGSLGGIVSDLKDSAMEGNPDALDALVGMVGTDSKLALPAIQDVYNDLLLNDGDQDLIDSLEQAILDNPNALRDQPSGDTLLGAVSDWLNDKQSGDDSGAGDGAESESGDDNGTGTGGNGFNIAGGKGCMMDAAAILALQMYYDETKNPSVLPVMSSLAQQQLNLGNPLVFTRVNDSSGEYLPLTSIQPLTGRRFVWNKNKSLGVLAFGIDYYGFTMYSDWVLRDRDGLQTERMERPTKNQGVIHIPEEYSQNAFGVQVMYLTDTDLGCAYDAKQMEMAQELFNQLLEQS